MRVLITRPAEEAAQLAASLAARGIESLVEPLLEIAPAGAGPVSLEGVQALAFTSANGVRAFGARVPDRDLPVFAIGASTAEAARAAGFDRVESAEGAVPELAALIRARLDPAQGAVLHGAGAVVKGDLGALLRPAGFDVRRAVLYEAVARRALSAAAVESLRGGRLDAVLFFSPRTAATFVSLAAEAGLVPACARLRAVCLSPAVAEAAAAVPWQAVQAAARPDQSALLDLLAQPGDGAGSVTETGASDGAAPDPADHSPAGRIVRAFGGVRPMAAKLGVPVTTVQGWKTRGHIPPARHAELRAAAGRLGIEVKEADLIESPTATPEPAAPDAAPPAATAAGDADRAPPAVASARSPHPARNIVPWIAASAAIIVLALAVSWPFWGPLVGLTVALPGGTGFGAQIEALDRRIGRLEAAGSETGGAAATQKLAALSDQLTASERKLGALERAFAELAARPEAKAGVDPTQLAALAGQIGGLKTATAQLGATLDSVQQRLAALEAANKKLAEADARRAALLLAVGQLRTALAGSAPYAAALAEVSALAQGDDASSSALDALQGRAGTGVPTLAQLTSRFDTASVAAAQAAIAPPDRSWLGQIWARLARLVVIRRVDGEAAGEGADAVLARASARLKAGDLAGAVDALSALQGAPAAAMAPWLADAKARLAADAAVDALGARAIARLGAARP